jgi:hypothetical protein
MPGMKADISPTFSGTKNFFMKFIKKIFMSNIKVNYYCFFMSFLEKMLRSISQRSKKEYVHVVNVTIKVEVYC